MIVTTLHTAADKPSFHAVKLRNHAKNKLCNWIWLAVSL